MNNQENTNIVNRSWIRYTQNQTENVELVQQGKTFEKIPIAILDNFFVTCIDEISTNFEIIVSDLV